LRPGTGSCERPRGERTGWDRIALLRGRPGRLAAPTLEKVAARFRWDDAEALQAGHGIRVKSIDPGVFTQWDMG
jgi:hypothetical protein